MLMPGAAFKGVVVVREVGDCLAFVYGMDGFESGELVMMEENYFYFLKGGQIEGKGQLDDVIVGQI